MGSEIYTAIANLVDLITEADSLNSAPNKGSAENKQLHLFADTRAVRLNSII